MITIVRRRFIVIALAQQPSYDLFNLFGLLWEAKGFPPPQIVGEIILLFCFGPKRHLAAK
jgi:hypothetical protein